ncbi:MAG: TetR/AcrR family transcriptional regulator [Lachnospiraceae bacterium]|nr:TetR/AcrR family transcriptional regulator [Lachnospiraceae bacterium]
MQKEKKLDKWGNDPARRANAEHFIACTYDLIRRDGLSQLSIRKIADRAGFHNSTIYLYFQDSDELIFLACIKYLDPYAAGLAQIENESLPSLERFYRVWELFCSSAFADPQIFRHIFFGKYGEELTDMLHLYYELFPDEKGSYSDEMREMFYGKSIKERSMTLLNSLCGEKECRVTKDNVEQVNRLLVYGLKAMLEEACDTDQYTAKKHTTFFLKMLHFLIDA